MSGVRVRFAPSPTGLLHIGGLRTALYNYIFARRHGGTFVLRIEDTDQRRYVPEAEADIAKALDWAGLRVDEGPQAEGDVGPYRQSERSAIYLAHVQQLIEAGHAYYAFDTPPELEAMRHRLQAEGQVAPSYNHATRAVMTNSLTLSTEDTEARLAAGDPHVIRLRVEPGHTVTFEDAVRGAVSFQSDEVDDQVLLKSDGLPTYHLANVVDDHLMGITHVIRGEEWLPSTPKHLLLYQAFGWAPPTMAHLPLILSPTGGKLSKRNAEKQGIPVSVQTYVDQGFEPAALINFLAFLGWNPGTEDELFSLDDLVKAFSLDRVHVAGVQFNMDKLRWYNEQYVRQLPLGTLADRMRPAVEAAGHTLADTRLRDIAQLMQERLTFPQRVVEEAPYLFEAPTSYDEKAARKRWKADTGALLAAYARALPAGPLSADEARSTLEQVAQEHEVKAGKMLATMRLALTGSMTGPDVYAMIALFGGPETQARIDRARAALDGAA
ncbi:MAG: glutamate--tRNA ligase [Bacteroidota bacterium]